MYMSGLIWLCMCPVRDGSTRAIVQLLPMHALHWIDFGPVKYTLRVYAPPGLTDKKSTTATNCWQIPFIFGSLIHIVDVAT